MAGLPDQDTFYDVVDCLEELGIAAVSQRHLNKKGTDLDLLEQFNIYEVTNAPFLSHPQHQKRSKDDVTCPPGPGSKRGTRGFHTTRNFLEMQGFRSYSVLLNQELKSGTRNLAPTSLPGDPSMCSSLRTFNTEKTQSYSVLKNMCSVVRTSTQGEVRWRGRIREEEGEEGRD